MSVISMTCQIRLSRCRTSTSPWRVSAGVGVTLIDALGLLRKPATLTAEKAAGTFTAYVSVSARKPGTNAPFTIAARSVASDGSSYLSLTRLEAALTTLPRSATTWYSYVVARDGCRLVEVRRV